MAVFEYRGILVGDRQAGQGRPRRGQRRRCSARALRKDGILLTVAHRGQGGRGEGQAQHRALRVPRPAVDRATSR